MTHRLAWLPPTVLVLVLTNCQRPSPTLAEADRAALGQIADAAERHFRARDFAAWARLYADDGVVMPPNHPPVQGRAALQAWADSFPLITDLAFSDRIIDGACDLALLRSVYSFTLTRPGAPATTDRGKQLVVFRRQPDGSWLVTAATFNSDLPSAR